MHEYTRLAATGAGKYENRFCRSGYRCLLRFVEFGE